MPSESTALTKTTNHDALAADDAQKLAAALGESQDTTVFVNGTSIRLPAQAASAVLDLLHRMSQGEAVTISTSEKWLNTSQAAQLAGVSNTYMRNLTDDGTIPVQYRGSHRRIRPEDVLRWLEERAASRNDTDAS